MLCPLPSVSTSEPKMSVKLRHVAGGCDDARQARQQVRVGRCARRWRAATRKSFRGALRVCSPRGALRACDRSTAPHQGCTAPQAAPITLPTVIRKTSSASAVRSTSRKDTAGAASLGGGAASTSAGALSGGASSAPMAGAPEGARSALCRFATLAYSLITRIANSDTRESLCVPPRAWHRGGCSAGAASEASQQTWHTKSV